MDIDREILAFAEERHSSLLDILSLNPQPIPPGDPRVAADLLGTLLAGELIRAAWIGRRLGVDASAVIAFEPGDDICPPTRDLAWILKHVHPHGPIGPDPIDWHFGPRGPFGPGPDPSPFDDRIFDREGEFVYAASIILTLSAAPRAIADSPIIRSALESATRFVASQQQEKQFA